MPSMKNWRNAGEAVHRPCGPLIVKNKPMTKEPLTLTTKVPQGNVSPMVLAIQPENHQRPRLPRPPPTNIHNAFHIVWDCAINGAIFRIVPAESPIGMPLGTWPPSRSVATKNSSRDGPGLAVLMPETLCNLNEFTCHFAIHRGGILSHALQTRRCC
jgi:hypothetical protein